MRFLDESPLVELEGPSSGLITSDPGMTEVVVDDVDFVEEFGAMKINSKSTVTSQTLRKRNYILFRSDKRPLVTNSFLALFSPKNIEIQAISMN